jgi:hypothetical protein
MLSYLIAVDVQNIIESHGDIKTSNFDLNLMMKGMES